MTHPVDVLFNIEKVLWMYIDGSTIPLFNKTFIYFYLLLLCNSEN